MASSPVGLCASPILFLSISLALFLAQPHQYGQRLTKLADWKIGEFEPYLAFLGALVFLILFKTFYSKIPFVAEYVPQSLVLIVFGVVTAEILKASGYSFGKSALILTPSLFFNFLLPPIVLDASYNLSNRTFADFLISILVYAVLGTLINFFIIGPLMYVLHVAGAMERGLKDISLSNYLLFSALIVAVDPVAVLAIFQEIGVNLGLYYMVFGESLLNDAVTVVLYEIMREFASATSVSLREVGFGIASFFTISLGGMATGLLMGLVSCILTRWESHLASILLILLALFSYFITNCVGWSGIIALICCGLMQSGYAFHNINMELATTLQEIVTQTAEISEAFIFLLLGIQVATTKLQWSSGFCLWALVVCTFARAVSVIFLSQSLYYLKINHIRVSCREQIIMIYGGLRGAVASSLAFLLKDLSDVDEEVKKLIITCTLFIIAVTVGFQGLTMRPLVKLIRIRLEQKQTLSIVNDLTSRVIDHTLAGVESILGAVGKNRFREFIARLDNEFIRPILQKNPERHDAKVVKTYEQIALHLHWATVKPQSSTEYLKDLPENLVNKFLSGEIDASGSRRSKGPDEASLFDVITDVPPMKTGPVIRLTRRKSSVVEPQTTWMRPTSVISERSQYRQGVYKEKYLTVLRRKSMDWNQSDTPNQLS
ncbi:hypothetical protein Aperf_G00000045447 [Anoplocephala perfoliata]